jgi:hypothetical protein
MSVICNDFAWVRKDTLSSDGPGWSISDSAKTSQDINQRGSAGFVNYKGFVF